MSQRKTKYDTKTLTTMAMLTALAYAVMAVCKVIPKVGNLLSLDAIDAVIGIGGFLFGPAAAVMMIVVEALIEMVTLSTTGWYGLLMNILSTTLLICPAVLIYRRKRTTAWAAFGLVVGVICRTLGMILFNYLITPYYLIKVMEVNHEVAQGMVVGLMPMISTFNLVKGVLNAALLMLVYPPVSAALRKVGLVAVRNPETPEEKRKFNVVPMLLAGVVLAGAVLAVLAMLEVI